MKKINLMIVATARYIEFLPRLVESVEKYFLKDCDVQINIFTDADTKILGRIIGRNPFFHYAEHKPWPHATLKRLHFFQNHRYNMPAADYYFYIDADTVIQSEIKSEDVLGERVVVQHCGYTNQRGTYETNPKSQAYIKPEEGTHYFGGGVWCFSSNEFWKFVDKGVNMINIDEANGIVPVYHDESVLNRYMIDNPPTKILTPSYHYPQSRIEHYKKKWGQDYPCKILLLDKKHSEYQV